MRQIIKIMNRNFYGAFGALVLGAALTAMPAKANLIMNGSFEDGAFAQNADTKVMKLPDGSTAITGWTVVGGNTSGDIAWEENGNPWSFNAQDGVRFLDLTGYGSDSTPHSGIKVSQTVNTINGLVYQLAFALGSSKQYSDGADPQITVTVNGTPSSLVANGHVNYADGPGNNHWELFNFTFTANGPQTDIAFFNATTSSYDRVIELDNVSLTCVPEPTTTIAGALLLVPLGASAIRTLRKQRAA